MGELPDPDWYLDHVLLDADPGRHDNVGGPAAQWRRWWFRTATDARLALAATTSSGSGAAERDALASAARHGFVLSTDELTALGISRSAHRTAVRRGRWQDVGRGFVAPLDPATDDPYLLARRLHALRAAAAQQGRPTHVIAAASAAVLHGLPVLAVPERPELLARRRNQLGRRGCSHAYSAGLAAEQVQHWFGVPVTTVARTLVDLARHDRSSGLMAADAALRERLVDASELGRALDIAAGQVGVRQAREVLALADPRAESPLESLVRLRLHDSGFSPPQLQLRVGQHRVDFGWPQWRLVLEADGRLKYSNDALWQEKRREQALRALGYRVERVVWDDVVRTWDATAARLRLLMPSA